MRKGAVLCGEAAVRACRGKGSRRGSGGDVWGQWGLGEEGTGEPAEEEPSLGGGALGAGEVLAGLLVGARRESKKNKRPQEGDKGGGNFPDVLGVTGSCRPAPAPRWRPARPRSACPGCAPHPCAWRLLSSRSPGCQKWPTAKGTRPCSPPRPCPQTRGCWPP